MKKRNLITIILTVVVLSTVTLIGIGLYYKNDLDNRTKAATILTDNSSVTSSEAIISNPDIPDPALPGVSGVTKTVCSSGCDYNAIQDAFINAPNQSKVFIKNGKYVYNFTFQTVGPKELTIEGESVDGVIIDGSLGRSGVSSTLRFDREAGKYSLKNLTVLTSWGGPAIWVGGNDRASNDTNFTAENVKVVGSAREGIQFLGSSIGKVTNSIITSSKDIGVRLNQYSKVKFTGGTIISNTGAGISLEDNSQGYFENNTISTNGGTSTTTPQVSAIKNSYAGFKSNTFVNTKYTAYKLVDNSAIRTDSDAFDGTTDAKKFIVANTANITYIQGIPQTSTSTTSSTTADPTGCKKYDFNSDGKVDIIDFAKWRTCYLKTGAAIASSSCTYADINSDSKIDITDFASFIVAVTNYRTTANHYCVK